MFQKRSYVTPRRLALLLSVLGLLLIAVPASAGTAGTYKGKATSMDRDFNYGKVTMKVRGGKVTSLVIEGVTTSGCGGFMDVVFAPKDRDTKIVKGSARIKTHDRLSVTYRPLRSIEDQVTTIKAHFTGSKVSGTFKSGTLCNNRGRFTAKK
ncbi:hypothetical protein BH10ACT11_BH10ACT11_07140 [soil metagenome]